MTVKIVGYLRFPVGITYRSTHLGPWESLGFFSRTYLHILQIGMFTSYFVCLWSLTYFAMVALSIRPFEFIIMYYLLTYFNVKTLKKNFIVSYGIFPSSSSSGFSKKLTKSPSCVDIYLAKLTGRKQLFFAMIFAEVFTTR